MRKLPEDISNSEAVLLGIQLLEDVQLTASAFHQNAKAWQYHAIWHIHKYVSSKFKS